MAFAYYGIGLAFVLLLIERGYDIIGFSIMFVVVGYLIYIGSKGGIK